MLSATGHIINHVILPVAFNTGDTIEERDQLVISLKALADEREYQFNMNLGPDSKAPSTDQLDQWMGSGTPVTVFAATARAVPFAHDTTTKDKDGNTKRYLRSGRKVSVGKVQVEIDSFITFDAYEVQAAGQVDLLTSSNAAHGSYLKRQAEFKKKSNAARIAKAKARVEEQKRTAKKSA